MTYSGNPRPTDAVRFRRALLPVEASWPRGDVRVQDGESATHQFDQGSSDETIAAAMWAVVKALPKGLFDDAEIDSLDFEKGRVVPVLVTITNGGERSVHPCVLRRGPGALHGTRISFPDRSRDAVSVGQQPNRSASDTAEVSESVIVIKRTVLDTREALLEAVTADELANLEAIAGVLWRILNEENLPQEVETRVRAAALLLGDASRDSEPGVTPRYEWVGVLRRGLASLSKTTIAMTLSRVLYGTIQAAGYIETLAEYLPEIGA